MQKQHRTFEISLIHIWFVVLVIIIALTIIFEIGIEVGRMQERSAYLRLVSKKYIQSPEIKGSSVEKTPISTAQLANFSEEKKAQQETPKNELEEKTSSVKEIQYTVQVAAFSSFRNAAVLVNSLRAGGHTCWMEPESPSDMPQVVYRVFVGSFRTRKIAEQIGAILVRRQPSITGYEVKEIGK